MRAFHPLGSDCSLSKYDSSSAVATSPASPSVSTKMSLKARMVSVCARALSVTPLSAPSSEPSSAAVPTSALMVKAGARTRSAPDASAAAGTATEIVSGLSMA